MKIANRMSRLGTETAFEVMAQAKALERQGKDIIYLQIGEPDFATPTHIVDGAIKALRDGHTHYSAPSGILPLKEAIADEVYSRRGVRPDVEQIVVTPGAKPIIFFVILACIESGDEVIYPNPGFPIYESMINFVGGRAVPLPLREENEFSFDQDEFMSLLSERTRMIIINSPHNPTGGVLSDDDVDFVSKVAKEKNILVLTDEVYKNIIYGAEHKSIYSVEGMNNLTVLLDGFSKTYAMTGWRLGYGVMPKQLSRKIERLMTNCNSCTATFSQYAAIEALKGPTKEVDEMVEIFKTRRDFIVDGLNNLPGVSCVNPKGAFYVFPNVKELGISSNELENYLLHESGVAVLSGSAFGSHGDGYLRLSYANSIENIDRALSRIHKALERI
ncbi:MAG: pyridoxal phosphate-dependent aminotransferase [Candidatus Thioglobus sp.]|jgi:aspartate/methionine/tyrosine aminotransferase